MNSSLKLRFVTLGGAWWSPDVEGEWNSSSEDALLQLRLRQRRPESFATSLVMVIFADLLISTWNLYKCRAPASKNDNKVWLSSFYFTECPIILKLRKRSELNWVKQQYFSFSVSTSELRLTQAVSRSENTVNRAQLGVWFPTKKVLNL